MTRHICGFYYFLPNPSNFGYPVRQYLPQVELQAHTTILSTTSRTTLTQNFVNPSQSKGIKELRYTFPLYDGVSVVGFRCRVGDRVIIGEVKEKEKAKEVYQEAVARGETAGLLEQLPNASDVFTTTVGNVPAGATLVTEITYLGELKHDAEIDGIRFTVPTVLAPRYGSYPGELANNASNTRGKGIEITVDAEMPQNSFIQQIQSPSHPISVRMGNTSVAPNAEPRMNSASATLSLGSAELDTDFVLQVVAKDTGIPNAVLETHPTIPNQRALMATLVPKFSLPPEKPEIVFICDRSGSMAGSKIPLVISALKVFLKSLPLGVKFNICSFGSSYSFLWEKSKAYSQSSLAEAIKHVEGFSANFGGTEMFKPIQATLERRYKDIPLEVMLLTDGEIWDQSTLFSYLNTEIIEKKAPIRVFTLGIGNGVSHALIEGVAKAGNGFSQAVGEGEKFDSKVVRMLKGALSPHVNDYSLEVKYVDEGKDDDFEIIERVIDNLSIKTTSLEKEKEMPKKAISLFDTSVNLDKEEPAPVDDRSGEARYSHLPTIAVPSLLQAPQNIPPLFPFSRTSVYLLMGPGSAQKAPKSVVLRGTSTHGPLELEIPVQILETPGETIHQLAAKKAIAELEQGRGWLSEAKDEKRQSLKQKYESRFEDMVEREAVRLGVQFQVGGKWCSFVAVESNKAKGSSAIGGEIPAGVEWLDMPSSAASPPVIRPANHHNTVRHQSYSSQPYQAQYTGSSFGSNLPALQKAASGAPPAAPGGMFRARGGFGNASPQSTRGGGLFGSAQTKGSTAAFGSSYRAPPPPMRSSFGAFAPASAAAAPLASRKIHSNAVSFDAQDEDLMDCSEESDQSASRPSSQVYTPPSARQAKIEEELNETRAMMSENAEKVMQRGELLDSLVSKSTALSSSSMNFRSSSAIKERQSVFGSMFGGAPQAATAAPAPFGQSSQVQAPASSPPQSTLDILVDLQTFEGFWDWNDVLFAVIRVSKEQAEKLTKSNGWSQRVVATALTVAFFQKKLAVDKDAWELVVDKAKGWLEEQVTGGAEGVVGMASVLVG